LLSAEALNCPADGLRNMAQRHHHGLPCFVNLGAVFILTDRSKIQLTVWRYAVNVATDSNMLIWDVLTKTAKQALRVAAAVDPAPARRELQGRARPWPKT